MVADSKFTKDTQLADLSENPNKYGLPTFEEFAKNPDKWRYGSNQIVNAIDRGTSLFSNVSHHTYKIKTKSGMIYDCGQSLEKAEYVARQEGYGLADLKCRPEMREGFSTKMYVEVLFEVP